jgi:hypothetical protein
MNAVVLVTPQDRILDHCAKVDHFLTEAMVFADMKRGNLEEKRERRKSLRSYLLNAYLAILWAEDPVNEMQSIDTKTAYVKVAAIVTAIHRSCVGELLIHPTLIEREIEAAKDRLQLLVRACRIQ